MSKKQRGKEKVVDKVVTLDLGDKRNPEDVTETSFMFILNVTSLFFLLVSLTGIVPGSLSTTKKNHND